jgi:hypothetical protein
MRRWLGTVNGGGINWRTESVFNAAASGYNAVSGLSATDFVVAYHDGGNSDYGTAIVGTVSGDGINWRTESVFNAAYTQDFAVSSLSASDFVVVYQDMGNSYYGTARVGTLSGGTLSWGVESVFSADSTEYVAVSSLSAADFVVAYWGAGTSSGTARAGHHWRLIGTARTAASGGETVPVIISGVSDVHSGLVPGRMYYLQDDGSLGLAPTDYRVGLAISATELVLDQLW